MESFDIPARDGVRQTIGDTLGIGGIFRGLRTIPVVVALAREMREICPDAYLLSYSNPMAMLPWAVYEGAGFDRGYGLCHSVRDTHSFLTTLVGADPERVRFLTAGFSHQAFVLRFEQGGESPYPRLADRAGSARRVPRARVPGGAARPEHGRHADHRADRGDVRRAARGPQGPAPAGPAGLAA
jgi:alpha-galactosidase/6-phospho-beta-glucosidase family protein